MRYGIFDANSWLYPDSKSSVKEIELYSPKNTSVGAQILFEFDECKAEVFFENTGAIKANFFEILEVCVNRNSDYVETRDYDHISREEMKKYYTRKAPYILYDPLLPLCDGKLISESKKAIYIKFNIPADVSEGEHCGNIVVRCPEGETCIPYRITVGDVIVDRSNNDFKMTHWLDVSPDDFGCESLTDDWWKVLQEMLELAHKAGQNMVMPLGSLFSYEGKHFSFDNVDRFIKMAFKIGYKYVEGPHLTTIYKIVHKGEINNFYSDSETVRICTAFMREWYDYLVKNDYDKITYQHIFDEPREINVDLYSALCQLAMECMPTVKTIDAILTKDIDVLPDVLVPTTRFYQLYKDDFDNMLASGKHSLWLYTCCWPSAPYLNRFMDMPLISTRFILWLCKKLNAEGFLHWALCTSVKGQDLYKEPSIPFKIFIESDEQYLPAGDMQIVYPYNGRPIGSMRLEMISAAIDDISLLSAIEDITAKEIMDSCISERYTALIDSEDFKNVYKRLCGIK